MNILHTSDWHIGKKLYNRDMEQEHRHFFDWLLHTIDTKQVDALLVSGDVFDTGYPSNASLSLYYEFLTRLQSTNCRQVIITGGNHDSVSTLDAPREVLRHLNVHVVGGAGDEQERMILPLQNGDGNTEAVVAAVPFLRDRDIRKTLAGETYEQRVEMIRRGIVEFYAQIARRISETYGDAQPVIAMGHLFMTGSTLGDSERDIHIGNLGALEAKELPDLFDYWALGHIHKPQRVAQNPKIRYSGSPLPLSFSERQQQKQVLLLELANGEIYAPEALEVPVFRELVRISGSFQEVTRSLHDWKSEGQTPAWADVEVNEENHNPERIRQLQEIVAHAQNPEILNYKIRFANTTAGADELYEDTRSLTDLVPRQVFVKKLESNGLDEEQQDRLLQAFNELMHEMENQEE